MKSVENIYIGRSKDLPGIMPPNSVVFTQDDGGTSFYGADGKKESGLKFGHKYSYENTSRGLGILGMNGIPLIHMYTPVAPPEQNYWRNLFVGEFAGWNEVTGKSDVTNAQSCTGIGGWALSKLTSGNENTAVGEGSLSELTTGAYNTAVGSATLFYITNGIRNVAVGRQAGVSLTTASNNVFVGSTAGFSKVGGGSLTQIDQSVLIGSFADGTQGATNEIAIGYNVEGKGSNTVTLGNGSITDTYLRGTLHAAGLQTFADNTAAAGLPNGAIYKTATGELRVKV